MEIDLKFKIYSNKQKPLNINNVNIQYKIKDNIGLRSFNLTSFEYDTLDKVYFNIITNQNYLDAVNADLIDYVLIEYDIDYVNDKLNFVDYNSLLAAYNIEEEENTTVQLKYIYQLKLNVISKNDITTILSSIKSIRYFSNSNELKSLKLNSQSINSSYNIIIDIEFDELPESFLFKFIETDINNYDALISYDVYQLGKLISMNRTHRHITKRHYFNRNTQDNQYLMLDFIDVCNVENINKDIDINQIELIKVTYSDDSYENITRILNKNECIFFSSKFGEISSIDINWKQNDYLKDKLCMIDVYSTDVISSQYRSLLQLFNPDQITKITKLNNYPMNIKIAIIQEWCKNHSTMLSISMKTKHSDNMVIVDLDINHIFRNYNFKYFCTYSENGYIYHIYMYPEHFSLNNINFIGMKYYFLDISTKYYLNISMFNNDTIEINDIILSGRSFNAVIPLHYTLKNDEQIAYRYIKDLSFYKEVKDLPSEYVKYGDFNIDEQDKTPTYIDIDLSLSRTFDGDFNILLDNQAVMQSLYNLFLSIKNDRPLKPWLEANLRNRLFDIEGNLLNHILKTYIENYVLQVEPRIIIDSLDTLYVDDNFNVLKVLIIFSIIDNDFKMPFSFDIEVE